MKTQNPLLGFSLALLAAATWGALAIAAQKVLAVMSAETLVWYRFWVAVVGLLLILGIAKKLPKLTAFSRKEWGLIALGVFGLASNFVLFSEALNYISPTTNQVLWQLAPFAMLFFSVVLFKEKFGLHQKIGLVLLIVGLIAFFNDRFSEILQFNTYAFGILLGASASTIWVAYGIAQKMLSSKLTSQQILLIIYFGCGVVLTPFAADSVPFEQMNGFLLGCFIFCCLNTLIGYGAYGEALNHWEASKVSAVTTLIPIFTMLFSNLGHYLFPDYFSAPNMNFLSYLGAFIVVFGAIFSAIGHKFLPNAK
ncbi:EamA family transporter [Haemophilus paracuniculus]|uniref:EamA family transporter n=1 Tax=Haemophilus paracuniculus TaxID=734 RepID=A0A1T0ATA2_9PAST|nr:DMT family transporter [Haemophilus paracuniculus]OOR99774.1 EamA family transporter [Haemophilus paracuniculus]